LILLTLAYVQLMRTALNSMPKPKFTFDAALMV